MTMLQYYTCMQYTHDSTYTKKNLTHSEMGPVRQNPIHRTVGLFVCVCIALRTTVAHNIAQNRPDNFASYPPDNHHCSDDVYLREGGHSVYDQFVFGARTTAVINVFRV